MAALKKTLVPSLALAATAACAGNLALEGPNAAAFLHRFSGAWTLDAHASDPAPRLVRDIVVTAMHVGNSSSGCRFTVDGGDLDRRICIGQREERISIPSSDPRPDSARAQLFADLAAHRPSQLVIDATDRFLHIVGGPPFPLPLSGAARQVDHAPDGPAVAARLSRDGQALLVELSVADDDRIFDRYEIAPDGSLLVTRTIGFSGGPPSPSLAYRFPYRRPGAPPA